MKTKREKEKRYIGKDYKRPLALCLSMAMTMGMLSGCGSKASEGDKIESQTQKGRYVEKEIELPEEWAGDIKQMTKINEELHLVSKSNENGNARVKEWVMQEDGTFAEVTQEWLTKLEFPYVEYSDMKLMQDEEGTQYFYDCFDNEKNYYQGKLWRSEGTEIVDITPESWSVFDEENDGFYFINDIAVKGVGTLVSLSYLSKDTIAAEDGSIVASEERNAYSGDWIEVVNGKEYQKQYDEFGCDVEGISIDQETIPFGQEKMSEVYFSVLADGSVMAADADGLFSLESGDTNWKKLLDGTETALGLVNMWCVAMTALSDGTIYALFNSDEGLHLMQYQYDPEAVIPVTEVVTLYATQESFLLQQATAMYHKKHPEILIEVKNAVSINDRYNDDIDYDQIYQELNTAMTAENGPDILVMDHLNMNIYADKGLLLNIDDVVAPLEEDGSLLSNITQGYMSKNGERYAVPLQFGIWLAVGRDISGAEMQSMESLANTLSGKQESYMGSRTAEELVEEFGPYFIGEIVQDKELNREALAVRLQQLNAIAQNCGMIEKRDENKRHSNIWEIASEVKLALCETNGFNDAMFPLSAVDLIKGEFQCFEQTYFPKLQIGVNSKSSHAEIAKDFIRFALSEEIQDNDYYEGFPVNLHSLEKQALADRKNAEACTSIDIGEGTYVEFNIEVFSEEKANRLVDMCKTANKRAYDDKKIMQELTVALPGYLKGDVSLEETINNIEGALKMYLAE